MSLLLEKIDQMGTLRRECEIGEWITTFLGVSTVACALIHNSTISPIVRTVALVCGSFAGSACWVSDQADRKNYERLNQLNASIYSFLEGRVERMAPFPVVHENIHLALRVKRLITIDTEGLIFMVPNSRQENYCAARVEGKVFIAIPLKGITLRSIEIYTELYQAALSKAQEAGMQTLSIAIPDVEPGLATVSVLKALNSFKRCFRKLEFVYPVQQSLDRVRFLFEGLDLYK